MRTTIYDKFAIRIRTEDIRYYEFTTGEITLNDPESAKNKYAIFYYPLRKTATFFFPNENRYTNKRYKTLFAHIPLILRHSTDQA